MNAERGKLPRWADRAVPLGSHRWDICQKVTLYWIKRAEGNR